MIKLFNPLNIYILLWLAYTLCSHLFPGTSLSQISLLLIMILSLYYAVIANIKYKLPKYFKALNLLILMFSVYGVLYFMFGEKHIITEGTYVEVPKIEYLKNIYMSMLPIYTFFVFSKECLLTEAKVRFLSIILIILSIFLYYWNWHIFVTEDIYGRTEFTNNMGYRFIALFPLLFFWRRYSFVQYFIFVIIIAFAFMSMKRGAILVASLCVLYYFYNTLQNAKGKKKIVALTLIVVIVIGAIYYIGEMLMTSDYLLRRINDTLDGNASNRQDMYPMMMDYFLYRATFLQFIFGGGANATIEVVDNYAHNDWFEIAINQGVLGLIIYFIYWKKLFKTWKKVENKELLKPTIGLFVIVYFFSSMFSMSYASMNISATICFAYCLSKIKY